MRICIATTGNTNSDLTYICNHFASGLVSLSVIGSFLLLLKHPLPGGSIFESELADNLTELVDVHVSDCMRGMSHEEQKGMESRGQRGRSEDAWCNCSFLALVNT